MPKKEFSPKLQKAMKQKGLKDVMTKILAMGAPLALEFAKEILDAITSGGLLAAAAPKKAKAEEDDEEEEEEPEEEEEEEEEE